MTVRLLPEVRVFALLAERHRRLLPEEFFADLFGSWRGRPSIASEVIVSVIVLQSLDGC